jgi:hypothetical protein
MEYYDTYLGSLKTNVDFENNVINLFAIDKQSDRYNLIVIPNDGKLENIDSMVNEIFKNIYTNIKQESNSGYLSFINYFLFFDKYNTNGRFRCKTYITYPNINFQIKRISTIKLSNNALNKCLVKRCRDANIDYNTITNGGYIGMSRELRIVCLADKDESLENTLFGIWMNFPNENIGKNPDEKILESFIRQNRLKIYEKSFNFLMKSSKINIINSPSPNEGVFLLILFISGIPFYFETKTLPNDKETIYKNYSNEWLITRKEFVIDSNNLDVVVELNGEKNGFITESLSRHMNSGSFANILQESARSRKTFEDPLVELFEPSELEEEINFPLQRARIRPEVDHQYVKRNLLNTESDTLTISSSKGSISTMGNYNLSKHGRQTSHMDFKNVKYYLFRISRISLTK